MNDKNEIKIGDLGEAKNIEESLLGTTRGTLAYMSPEMIQKYLARFGAPIDTDLSEITDKTDIW